MDLEILSSWNGGVRPLPPISSSQQCAMCNAMCLPVHCPISVQLPLLQKKSWHTSLWLWHHLITKYWLQKCCVSYYCLIVDCQISFHILPCLYFELTHCGVCPLDILEMLQRRGKVSDFPPHYLSFTFMQVQLNTSLLLDGLPTKMGLWLASFHWYTPLKTEHLCEEHRHMCFKHGCLPGVSGMPTLQKEMIPSSWTL